MKWMSAFFIFISLALSGQAQEWPGFRGPNAAGVNDAKPLPTSWNAATGQNVKWKTALSGLGHSSPIIWGNRIFLTAAWACF